MDNDRERRHLAQADRHVAQLKKHIASQREIVERLSSSGHPSQEAVAMLELLEDKLRIIERHRRTILDKLQKAKPD